MAKDKRKEFSASRQRDRKLEVRQRESLQQKKSLGQVFLNETWPCEKVVETLLKWQVTHVLEIGPGKGALTTLLLKAGLQVTAVEKDERFAAYVREHATSWSLDPEKPQIEVKEGDFLTFDLENWVSQATATKVSGSSPTPRCAVVGNIPYNISTPILIRTFESINRLSGAIFLTQLEFAERVAAKPGGKEYGSLTVLCSLYCNANLIAKVSREAFTPVPRVDSALVTLQPKAVPETPARIRMVETVTRRAFQQRRKMLRNSLAAVLPTDDGGTTTSTFPVDLNRRPETLSLEEFIRIAEFLAINPREEK